MKVSTRFLLVLPILFVASVRGFSQTETISPNENLVVEGVPPRGEWQEPNTEYLAAKFSTYMDRRFSVGPISARWQLKEPAN